MQQRKVRNVVNRTCHTIHGGLFAIMSTVPINNDMFCPLNKISWSYVIILFAITSTVPLNNDMFCPLNKISWRYVIILFAITSTVPLNNDIFVF